MLNKVKTILSDERGTTYIESGLWIALVVLVVAGAGVALAGIISEKFGDIGKVMEEVTVPDPEEVM